MFDRLVSTVRCVCIATLGLGAFAATGCASYVVPGRAADMTAFTDDDLKEAYNKQPASPIPARVAVVRVQESGYHCANCVTYGRGRYSIVTVRDVETEGGMKRIKALPDLAGVATLNRLVLSPQLNSAHDLRRAAASLQTDMLLIYTFDTSFWVEDGLRPLTVITLGLFPTKVAHVTATGSALLMDVRTGYIYAVAEVTQRAAPLANAWTSGDAVDKTRHEVEAGAFTKLVADFERIWPQVVKQRKDALAAAR